MAADSSYSLRSYGSFVSFVRPPEHLDIELEDLFPGVLDRNASCYNPKITEILEKLDYQCEGYSKLRDYSLEKTLADKSFEPGVMKVVGCMIVGDYNTEDRQKYAEEMNKWIKLMSPLSSGSYGSVYRPGIIMYKTQPFVIKMALKKDESLSHESFIGIMALNKLRDIVPNFVYTYGCLLLPSPVEVGTFKSVGVGAPSVKYLFLENIQGDMLFDFVRSLECTPSILINISLQIFYALNEAHKMFNFTHYDLHSNNIMIQRLVKPVQIVYQGKYLLTKYIAYIIDYGRSYIRIEGEDYGMVEGNGEHCKQSYPLFDIRRYLLSILMSGKFKDYIERWISYISSLKITRQLAINLNKAGVDLRPFKSGYEVIDYNYMIDILLQEPVIKEFLSDKPYPVDYWSCQGGYICRTPEEVIEDIVQDEEIFRQRVISLVRDFYTSEIRKKIMEMKLPLNSREETNLSLLQGEYLSIIENIINVIKDYRIRTGKSIKFEPMFIETLNQTIDKFMELDPETGAMLESKTEELKELWG